MSGYSPYKAGTLLIPSGTYHEPDKKHLFIVCNDPIATGDFFLTTVATWRNSLCDGTRILDAGCHPFIKRRSYVLYRSSRIELGSTLARGVDQGVFVPRDPFDEKLLDAVVEGILASPHTPRKLKSFFRKNCSPAPF